MRLPLSVIGAAPNVNKESVFMSNDKHRNSSSSQGEMESEMIDLCDLCCNNGPIHTIRSMGLCRTCDSIFDYILNAALEGFVTGSPPSRLRLVARLCREQDGLCGICDKRIEPWESMHLDHIVPVSRGGSHDRKNLQAAHALCNLRKGNRMPLRRRRRDRAKAQ